MTASQIVVAVRPLTNACAQYVPADSAQVDLGIAKLSEWIDSAVPASMAAFSLK